MNALQDHETLLRRDLAATAAVGLTALHGCLGSFLATMASASLASLELAAARAHAALENTERIRWQFLRSKLSAVEKETLTRYHGQRVVTSIVPCRPQRRDPSPPRPLRRVFQDQVDPKPEPSVTSRPSGLHVQKDWVRSTIDRELALRAPTNVKPTATTKPGAADTMPLEYFLRDTSHTALKFLMDVMTSPKNVSFPRGPSTNAVTTFPSPGLKRAASLRSLYPAIFALRGATGGNSGGGAVATPLLFYVALEDALPVTAEGTRRVEEVKRKSPTRRHFLQRRQSIGLMDAASPALSLLRGACSLGCLSELTVLPWLFYIGLGDEFPTMDAVNLGPEEVVVRPRRPKTQEMDLKLLSILTRRAHADLARRYLANWRTERRTKEAQLSPRRPSNPPPQGERRAPQHRINVRQGTAVTSMRRGRMHRSQSK